MAKHRQVVLSGDEEGYISGPTFFRDVSPDTERVRFSGGYALPDRLIDHLVDQNVEHIVLIEPYRRLTSALTDWQDYGKEVPDQWTQGWTGLSLSFMAKR